MKAIETHYLGPTVRRGSRIVANDNDGNRVIIRYPDESIGEAAHKKAAEILCERMGWRGELRGGQTKRGYAFVFIS